MTIPDDPTMAIRDDKKTSMSNRDTMQSKDAMKQQPAAGVSLDDGASVKGARTAHHGAPSDLKAPKHPSKIKLWWDGLGLDLFTVLLMAKGGLPPAIALALFQINAIAGYFQTIGYIMAIISILGMAVLPRAKFIQTMISHLVMLCFAAAFALLIMYCSTEARRHTSTPQTLTQYNSSASTVSAIWLFFQIYLVNTLRAKFPQLQLPVIMYSIFVIVSCTYSAQFPTMAVAQNFVKRLLEGFLSGLAVSTAVQFLVLPVTVRTVVFKIMTGYLGLLTRTLRAYQAYVVALEDPEKLRRALVSGTDASATPLPEASALKGNVAALIALYGKLQGDLPFAKREFALGKLGPSALGAISKRLRDATLPTIGLTALVDLLERIAQFHGWSQQHLKDGLELKEQAERDRIVQEWTFSMKALREPFSQIIDASCDGLEHIALRLELRKPPKHTGASAEDIEAKAEGTRPGDDGFAEYLHQKIETFYSGKRELLREWCHKRGIELSRTFFDNSGKETFQQTAEKLHVSTEQLSISQRQLYLLLYMEFLLWSASKAILQLVKYSDELVTNGTLSKTRLIMPGWRRIKKWIRQFFKPGEATKQDPQFQDLDKAAVVVDFGSAFRDRRDPEHLPPQNRIEKIGDGVRGVTHFMRSAESAFGFRVAVATMSVAVLAFLHQTQTWFVNHRVLWAMIMVAISMTPTAGQSLFSFVLRIFGTIVAMVLAFICYYIVDGKVPGMIVFLWLFVSMGLYFPLKRPAFAVVGIISVVTLTLIIGYEVEVIKIGVQAAVSNGQEFLPVYKIAPYRLATVAAGLAVAFFWTMIPYPITDHSLLRQNVGAALYLLGNYHSVVHETIKARIRDAEGDCNSKNSVGARLGKMRIKIFTKQTLVLTNLQTYSNFLKYEIPVGGRFPKKQYVAMVKSIEAISRYISLLSYSSQSLVESKEDDHHLSQWSKDLKTALDSLGATSHEITSLFTLLSHSMSNGQPLPPYLKAPTPYGLSQRLQELDPDILSVRHIDEPEYAVFAVFQIAARCIVFELENLLENVRELVGELDFSFHVANTADSSKTALVDGLEDDVSRSGDRYKRKGD